MRALTATTSILALSVALSACTTVQPGPTPPGEALNFSGPGLYGDVEFSGDATSTPVRAGGAIDASQLDANCYGFINERPTLTANVTQSGPLYIAGAVQDDTVLVVRAPDGAITCDDDGADFPNPGIAYDDAEQGLYEIWLGTYDAGIGYPSGAVHLSADGFLSNNPFLRSIDPSLPAGETLALQGGFADDPRSVSVTAGGDLDLDTLSGGCPGYSGEAADLTVTYEADGGFDLFFLLETADDATIAVQTPGGEVLCNDDQVGLDAGVQINAAESGEYLVWAGLLYEEGSTAPGTLSISEIGFSGVDNRLDVTAAPGFGAAQLEAGFLPDPYRVDLTAGGPIDVSMAIAEDATVAEGYCSGYVTQAPSFELTFNAGDGPLFITATSEDDTTLVINAPDGAWYCNDDADMGLDSELYFASPLSGVYDIWVGTYSMASDVAAVLSISEMEGLSGSEAMSIAEMD